MVCCFACHCWTCWRLVFLLLSSSLLLEMSWWELQFLRCCCSYGLVLCFPVLDLLEACVFVGVVVVVCWRCHCASFWFCGVHALMVCCFACHCWTCWRLVFLLLSSSLLLEMSWWELQFLRCWYSYGLVLCFPVLDLLEACVFVVAVVVIVDVVSFSMFQVQASTDVYVLWELHSQQTLLAVWNASWASITFSICCAEAVRIVVVILGIKAAKKALAAIGPVRPRGFSDSASDFHK